MLKFFRFTKPEEAVAFVNENHIRHEDVYSITNDCLYYWQYERLNWKEFNHVEVG